VAVAPCNKRGGSAHQGVPVSVRQRRCFGWRRSPRWRCSGDLRRPQAGLPARFGGGGEVRDYSAEGKGSVPVMLTVGREMAARRCERRRGRRRSGRPARA
jgi:hypothetical protein